MEEDDLFYRRGQLQRNRRRTADKNALIGHLSLTDADEHALKFPRRTAEQPRACAVDSRIVGGRHVPGPAYLVFAVRRRAGR